GESPPVARIIVETCRLLGPLTFHGGRGADLLPTSAAARHASSLPGRLFSIYQDYNGFAWLALTIIAQVQYEPRPLHPVGSQVPYMVQKALMTEGPILLGMRIYQDHESA
ncbi:mdh, partial [Symbiodinium sp. KB8]